MDTYEILNGSFEVNLEEGEYTEQFSLVFEAKKTMSELVAIPYEEFIETMYESTRVFMNNSDGLIRIKKPNDVHKCQWYCKFGKYCP